MIQKLINIIFIFITLCCNLVFAYSPTEDYLLASASLICHVEECINGKEEIIFTPDEITHLWDRVNKYHSSFDQCFLFEEAFQNYQKKENLQKISVLLTQFWQKAQEANHTIDHSIDFNACVRSKSPHRPVKIQRRAEPYLISSKHPMQKVLNSLFLKQRVTKDRPTFIHAGFKILAEGSRSYIIVAKHQSLPGYLVKVYLDTELRQKWDKKSWEWLVLRCEGASQIRKIIKRKKFKHFTVPEKYIYWLPPHPAPPRDENHTQHAALLLVTDMNLTSQKRNAKAWRNEMTQEHLDELYQIISFAKGSSYRPDNLAYTKNGHFAFIDTEYPNQIPDLKIVRKYFNSEMRAYWDSLIRKGGP